MRVNDIKSFRPVKRLSQESRPQKQNSLVKDTLISSTNPSKISQSQRISPQRRQSMNTAAPHFHYGRYADLSESGAVLKSPNLPTDQHRKLRVEKQQLAIKCDVLTAKLRKLAPDNDDTIYALIEHTDTRIQELQQTLKYKRDRIIGHYKLKTANMLEKLGFRQSDLNMQQVTSQTELVEFIIGKLTDKYLQLETMWMGQEDEIDNLKLERLRQIDEISRLTKQNKCLRDQLEITCANLHDAENSIQNMSRTLNTFRIEENTRLEKERLSLDRERLSEDIVRTKNNIRQTEQYYNEQLTMMDKLNHELQGKINQLTKELMDERLQFSEVCIKLQETKTQLDQALVHNRMEKEKTQKAERQSTRWKQRFQQLEKNSTKCPQVYRTPPIDYRSNKNSTPQRFKTLSSIEAAGLYDRKSVTTDQKTLGIFLDKQIKKLEGDLKQKGLITDSSRKKTSDFATERSS